jgi:hypothetical protein
MIISPECFVSSEKSAKSPSVEVVRIAGFVVSDMCGTCLTILFMNSVPQDKSEVVINDDEI